MKHEIKAKVHVCCSWESKFSVFFEYNILLLVHRTLPPKLAMKIPYLDFENVVSQNDRQIKTTSSDKLLK